MSASNQHLPITRYCYFADYEIPLGEQYTVWGQTTLVYQVANPQAFDPAEVVARIQRQAAEEHHIDDASKVRIRVLNRLS